MTADRCLNCIAYQEIFLIITLHFIVESMFLCRNKHGIRSFLWGRGCFITISCHYTKNKCELKSELTAETCWQSVNSHVVVALQTELFSLPLRLPFARFKKLWCSLETCKLGYKNSPNKIKKQFCVFKYLLLTLGFVMGEKWINESNDMLICEICSLEFSSLATPNRCRTEILHSKIQILNNSIKILTSWKRVNDQQTESYSIFHWNIKFGSSINFFFNRSCLV